MKDKKYGAFIYFNHFRPKIKQVKKPIKFKKPVTIVTAESEKKPYEEFIFIADIGESKIENRTTEIKRPIDLLEIDVSDGMKVEIDVGRRTQKDEDKSGKRLGKFKTSMLLD